MGSLAVGGRRLLALVAFASLAITARGGALAEPGPVVEFQGILRGTTLVLDPYFHWKPKESQIGILGTVEGTTREFENIVIEVGADRSVWTAAERVAFEADRVKRDVERGEAVTAKDMPLTPTLSIVRYKVKDVVYACAAKQIGRTALFARSAYGVPVKDEAALTRVVTATIAGAKSTADDVDGWLPLTVKNAWVHEATPDLVITHDGVAKAELKDEVAKIVREVHAIVRRAIPGTWAVPFPPVLRVTAKRDLFTHLSGRRDARESDAVYLPGAGELLVVVKSEVPIDTLLVKAAVEQALHHSLGGSNAQPMTAGLVRYALAIRGGASAGSVFPEGETQVLDRVKSKKALSWAKILKMQTVVNFLATEADERALDSEMTVLYLLHSGGAQAKTSLDKWAGGFRRVGHPDAAAEAAYHDLNPDASDAEYWKFWNERVAAAAAAAAKKAPPGTKPK